MNYTQYITEYMIELKKICETIDQNTVNKFIDSITSLKKKNGRLFILGVGGSAANASHAVNDFRKILNIEAYTVTDNPAELTARINDDGWDTSYINWLKVSRFNSKDTILILSVGGGSDTVSLNLVRAMEYAKSKKAKILSIVSRNGGKAKIFSDVCVLIPEINSIRTTPHAEEWQSIILHLTVNAVPNKRRI